MFGREDALKYINGYKSKVRNREPIITQRGIHRSPSQDMYFKGALFLHTLRSVVDDDERWWKLLRDFYQQFKYQNIMTEEFFNPLGDLPAFFTLGISPFRPVPAARGAADAGARVQREGRDARLPVGRRRAIVRDADQGGQARQWQIIVPTTDWATMRSPVTKDEFEVATDLFYVNVVRQ